MTKFIDTVPISLNEEYTPSTWSRGGSPCSIDSARSWSRPTRAMGASHFNAARLCRQVRGTEVQVLHLRFSQAPFRPTKLHFAQVSRPKLDDSNSGARRVPPASWNCPTPSWLGRPLREGVPYALCGAGVGGHQLRVWWLRPERQPCGTPETHSVLPILRLICHTASSVCHRCSVRASCRVLSTPILGSLPERCEGVSC